MYTSLYVYQYRPDKEDRDIDTLVSGQIYAPTVKKLNDPFEHAALAQLVAYPNYQNQLTETGVVCFCRSVTNSLLWSHYANSHKGFAIGFDPFHSFFGGSESLDKRKLMDVRYEDISPDLANFRKVSDFITASITTKPSCWVYEQEVRLIFPDGNRFCRLPLESVKEIAFGSAMNQERVNEIKQKIINAGINTRFIQMERITEGFGVKPVYG